MEIAFPNGITKVSIKTFLSFLSFWKIYAEKFISIFLWCLLCINLIVLFFYVFKLRGNSWEIRRKHKKIILLMCSLKWKQKRNTRKLPLAIPWSAFSFCFCFLYFPREGSCGKTMTAKWSTIAKHSFVTCIFFRFRNDKHCNFLQQSFSILLALFSFNNKNNNNNNRKIVYPTLMKWRNFLYNIFMLFFLSLSLPCLQRN